MQVTETLNEGLKRKLAVVIPAKDLNERLDARLDELKGKATLKGFRPGKVPVSHLKKVYGRSAMSEVMTDAINSTVQKTLEERSERAAVQPKVDLTEDQAEINRVLEGQADLVLLDAPPLLPVTDAAVLTAHASGAMLVVRSGSTTREQARRAVEILRAVDAHVFGVVLNMVPTKGPGAYKYGYYGYGYASSRPTEPLAPTTPTRPAPVAASPVPAPEPQPATPAASIFDDLLAEPLSRAATEDVLPDAPPYGLTERPSYRDAPPRTDTW
mgnify:CR=1 FL=1